MPDRENTVAGARLEPIDGRWLRACRTDDIRPGEAVVVPVEPPIAVFNVDGEFFATDDTCTHAESSLAGEGYIDDDVVECGFHYAQFCIRSGAVLGGPTSAPLRVHDVKIEDGVVYASLDGRIDG